MKRVIYLFATLLFAVNGMAQTKTELALKALQSEDYMSVIQYTTEQLTEQSKDVDALVLRATAYAVVGDLANAFADINAAIKYWTKKSVVTQSQLYLSRASYYSAIEDYDAALADLNMAVKKGKKNAENYMERAKFYYQRSEFALAEADCSMAVQLEPTNAEYQVENVRCILAQERYDEAEKYLQKVVKLYPKNEEALRLYALTFYYKKDYKAFVDWYIVYMDIAQEPDTRPLYDIAKQEFVYIVKALSVQIESSSDRNFWLSIRARIYRENRQYTEALTDLNQLEIAYGDSIFSPFIKTEFALCYEGLQDYARAIHYYDELIDFCDRNNTPEAFNYIQRASAYRYLGKYNRTIEDCDRALGISMDYAGFIYYLRGWAHELLKDNETAFEDYNKSIMFDGTYAYSYLMRGEQYLKHRQDTVRAMQDFERILELDTLAADGSCRQYALMFLGRTEEAKAWMEKMLKAEPDNSGNYYDAACLYALVGEGDEAMNFLHKAFELGYRNFQHIEADDDMDSLRERQDFKDLINRYKKDKVNSLLERLNF